MLCEKCKYDLGDSPLNYCPNCGKRIIVEEESKLENLDYLKYIGFDKFVPIWEKIHQYSSEEAFKWINGKCKPAYIFTIKLTIRFEGTRYRNIVRASLSDIVYYAKEYGDRCEAKIKCSKLNTSVSPKKFGENWWWEEEDCKAALGEALKEAKTRITIDDAFAFEDYHE